MTDDAGLFWDNTDKRIGIGTVSPDSALDVVGQITASSSYFTGLTNMTHASISDDLELAGTASISASSALFRPETDSTTFFQIASAAFVSGDDYPIFNVDTSNSRIGIGTTSPNKQLEIRGESGLQITYSLTPTLYSTLHWNMLDFYGQTGYINYSSNQNLGLVIGGGKVGIGTDSPDYKLEVDGTASISDQLNLGDLVSSGLFTGVHASISDDLTIGDNITFSDSLASISGPLILGDELTIASGMDVGSGDLYVDASDGSVGIGTTVPGALLDVKGDVFSVNHIMARSADYNLVLIGSRGSGVNLDRGEVELLDTGVVKIELDTAGNSYFNGGNVGIGTTNPSHKLTVLDNSGQSVLITSTVGDTVFQMQGLGASLKDMFSIRMASYDKVYVNTQNSYSLAFGVSTGTSGPTTVSHLEIDSSGRVIIDGSTPQSGYELTVNNDIYAVGDVSALTFTDRTPYPKDLATAYEAVFSMQRLPDGEYDENDPDKQLDHSKLSDFIKSESGYRSMSGSISAHNEVLKDLIGRMQELEQLASQQAKVEVSNPILPQFSLDDLINSLKQLGIIIERGIVKIAQLAIKTLVVEKNSDLTQSSIGEGIVKAESVSTEIRSNQIMATSKIFITFRNDYGSRWWINYQEKGLAIINIADPAPGDLKFDWWIVQTEPIEITSTPIEPPLIPVENSTPIETPIETTTETSTEIPTETSTETSTEPISEPDSPAVAPTGAEVGATIIE